MEVQMEHALAGLLADVGHHTVAVQPQFLGYICYKNFFGKELHFLFLSL